MNEEILHDKLEKYVRGLLSTEEADALERDIAVSSDLQEQLRLHKLELESHEYLLREHLRQNVREWIADAPSGTAGPKSSFFQKKWLRPFLILVLFSTAGLWFFFQNRGQNEPVQVPQEKAQETPAPITTPEVPIAETETREEPSTPQPERRFLALARSAYNPPPNIGEAMLRSDDPSEQGTDPLSLGIRAFKQEKYQAAIRAFDQITAQNNPKQYPLALEWKAHAWFKIGLQKGDFKPAAKLFQAMVDLQKDDVAQDRAEWYLLLCLVPDYPQQKKRADDLMAKIVSQEFHSYREDAESMQKSLRKAQ